MDNKEIVKRFDVLYNNIMSDRAPGLSEYEMSVFWNKATLEVLKNHLNQKGNRYGEGFDGSSKRQIDFSSLVCTLHYVFKPEDDRSTFNSSALRYGGIEELKSEKVTRYYVDRSEKDENGNYIYIVTPKLETVDSATIKDVGWPSDMLSIVNESVEVLTADMWHDFAFYMSQFVTYIFAVNTDSFTNCITDFVTWVMGLGFSESKPIIKYLVERLRDAIDTHLRYGDLTTQEVFAGIGFGESKSYDDALDDLNMHTGVLTVVPLNNVEYDTLMSRPYRYPPKSQAWRIITDGEPEFITAPCYHPIRYHLRYVRMPADVDLSSDVGSQAPAILHDEILQRAVELAKNAWDGDVQSTMTLGERSE